MRLPRNVPFWARFRATSEKRNAIVHKGGQATKADAEAAHGAAVEMVTYLKQYAVS
ncbi:MAG: hypothetical protein K8U57_12675 [Planctomycetes bacterium]|nr:hypothetical protein [Planctomycetota bacterium]